MIPEGGRANISCAHSTAVIIWLIQKSRIFGSSQRESCSCEEDRGYLTFSNFMPGSVGIYVCNARRPNFTTATCTVNITLRSQSVGLGVQRPHVMPFFFTVPDLPLVSIGETELQVTHGSNFTIRPRISFGSLVDIVTWSLNGMGLDENDPRVQISGGVLMVRSASTSGSYAITVSNSRGSSSATVNVNIGS